MQFPLLTNNCWNEQNQETYPTGPLLLILFLKTSIFWCKNVPCTRYETLLLTEKNLRSYSGFQKGLIHQLHCDFSDYEKNTLAWIFKWLVAWKRSLPRPKFFFENLSPSSTLSYTITKKPKRVNLRRKSHWGSWSSWGSPLIALSLGFTVIRVLFRFLIERILFRVLSDRVFFESSEIGSSSLGYAVIDSSLHQCSFSAMLLFFLSNRFTTFCVKNRYFVLDSL